MLGQQHRQVELGHGLEFKDEDLHHLDQQLFAVAAILLGPLSDTFHWKMNKIKYCYSPCVQYIENHLNFWQEIYESLL